MSVTLPGIKIARQGVSGDRLNVARHRHTADPVVKRSFGTVGHSPIGNRESLRTAGDLPRLRILCLCLTCQCPSGGIPANEYLHFAAHPDIEEPAAGAGCDPTATPCVPLVSCDLDWGDIGRSETVVGGDPHGFDREGDGLGCESY